MYSRRDRLSRGRPLSLLNDEQMSFSRENRGLTLATVRQSLTLKNVKEWLPGFPIVRWLPKYSMYDLQSDFTAGLTVGLMVVPQAIAYAGIAGLPHEYGLYSSFMGCLAYLFVGSAKDVTLGPTAIMSLMVNRVADPSTYGVNYAVTLSLICGVVQLLMSMFRLGAMMSFISAPVISGFTSAAAITIAMGQVKHIFGVKKHVPRPFIGAVNGTFYEVFHGDIRGGDIIMGLSCMIIVMALKHFKTVVMKWDENDKEVLKPRHVRFARKFLWFITTGRNALLVSAAALIAYALQAKNKDYLTLAGQMKKGLPSASAPPFSSSPPINSTTLQPCDTNCNLANRTGLSEMLSDFDVGVISVPLIGLLELVAIAQAFARQNNYVIDPNQELFAIGVANILSSFFSSYPVTGSFSRTAVNAQSGVRTPAAGIVTAAIVLLALGVLTPVFRFIPMAALSAIIITAVLGMVNLRIVAVLWRVKVADLIPLAVAFFGTLFLGIEYGVLLAVVINIMYLLYLQSRPHFSWKAVGDVVVLRLHGGLDFPSVTFLRQIIRGIEADASKERVSLSAVVVDWSCVMDVDYTVVLTLQDLCDELKRSDISLVHACLEPPVQKVLTTGIPNLQIYPTIEDAQSQLHIVNLSTGLRETQPLLRSANTMESTRVDDDL
eukprot:scpid38172/ scgid16926/ Sodium-independent sulfate anion transporter; Solute carrier family 26 member 11